MKNRKSIVAVLAVAGLGTSIFAAQRNMKVNSPIFDEISGKLGGCVGMTSKFGMQLRSLVTPSNPDTPQQLRARSILSRLTSFWSDTLTDDYRATWEDLAEATSGNFSGINLFIKANTQLLTCPSFGTPVNQAPDSLPENTFTPPTLTACIEGDNQVAFTIHEAIGTGWNNTGFGAVNVYVSREQPHTRNTRIHPFQYWGATLGNSTIGTSPNRTVAAPAGLALREGKVIYVKFVAFNTDGQVAHEIVQRVTITT